ncbi:MAG: hypothetical protein K9J85_10570 [Desulfobacteraceae bacterium]|nr:hypothetical protein [Desulfobacteraceae bacterium]
MWLSKILKKALVSLVLAAAVVWAVQWAMLHRVVENQDYGGRGQAEAFKNFAPAQYDFGIKAWYENRPKDARRFFARAVSINPLYVDAWLRLAEVSQAGGKEESARQILLFTNRLAGDVVRWKWKQLLMARQLGMEEMFVENVNFVIPFYKLRDQALDLLDMHYEGQAGKALEKLEPANLPDYLNWLIRRQRVEDSLKTWGKMTENIHIDRKLYERYVRFLFRQKKIGEAVRIRYQYTGLKDEMANPGFEKPLSGNVFGWHARSGDTWNIRRDRYGCSEGRYCLRVDFSGRENINFYHVRQYVPVEPGRTYNLSFLWKSRNLITDKLPFVEIRGAGCKNSYWKTPMIPSNTDWREQSIGFKPAEDCRAVMIRMRRHKSNRFDSDIDGTVWMDDFKMEKVN